jgi:DNA invertase Pin-like site-specific DNA recombinase
MATVAYIRVSTSDQEARGTQESQRQEIEKFCTFKGLKIHTWIYEQESGAKERKQFKALIDGVQAGTIRTVVVYALDRFSRSQIQTLQAVETIQEAKANFFTVRDCISIIEGKTDLGTEILISTMSLMAKNERAVIKSRTRLGKRRKTNDGLWIKGQPPVGYEIDTVTKILRENPGEAEWVRRIFNLRVNGQGVNAIVKALTTQRVPYFETRVHFSTEESRHCPVAGKQRNSKYCRIRPHNALYSGCQSCAETSGGTIEENDYWCKTSITRILRNRVYIGQVYCNGEQDTWIRGKHKSLVDIETFDLVQKLIQESTPRKGKLSFGNPLAGRVFCRSCGRPMHITTGGHGKLTKSGKPKKEYIAFRCTGRKVGICSQGNVRVEPVYESVYSWIDAFLTSEDTRHLIAVMLGWMRDNYTDDVERGLKDVRSDLKATDREIDHLNVAYLRAVKAGLSDETLNKGVLAELRAAQDKRSSLSNELLGLEARRSRKRIRILEEESDLSKATEDLLSTLLETWRSCQTNDATDTPEEKALKESHRSQVLRGLIERVDIEGQEHSITIGYDHTRLTSPEYGRFAKFVHLAYLASDQDKLLDII